MKKIFLSSLKPVRFACASPAPVGPTRKVFASNHMRETQILPTDASAVSGITGLLGRLAGYSLEKGMLHPG